MTAIWTVGHSTRTAAELTALLQAHHVQTLADVRSFPSSRRCPWFGRHPMADWLPAADIDYVHLGELGGRRNKQPVDPSINAGWTNPSFKNYADWTLSDEFAAGLAKLERLAVERRVAFMCSEAQWTRCHRRILSDVLAARGWYVAHITSKTRVEQHLVSAFGPTTRFEDGTVTYPSPQLSLEVAS